MKSYICEQVGRKSKISRQESENGEQDPSCWERGRRICAINV